MDPKKKITKMRHKAKNAMVMMSNTPLMRK
jgi:hypothetical protein